MKGQPYQSYPGMPVSSAPSPSGVTSSSVDITETLIEGTLTSSEVEHAARLPPHQPVIDKVEESGDRVAGQFLAAKVDVLVGRHGIDQRKILVDRLDPGIERVLGTAQLDRLTIDGNLAARCADDPRQDLEQRRLARPIVADQAQHFVAVQLQRCIRQRNDRPEITGDVPGFKDGFRRFHGHAERPRLFHIWNERPTYRIE